MWVKIFLKHEEKNFIGTKDIFAKYKNFLILQNCPAFSSGATRRVVNKLKLKLQFINYCR